MTNFKMTVRADYTVSAYNPLPQPIKALFHYYGGLWGESVFEQASLPPCPLAPLPLLYPAFKIKQLSLTPPWPLHWLLRGEQQDPTFSYNTFFIPQYRIFCPLHTLLDSTFQNVVSRTSLVAQWLRLRIPMQGSQVQSLVRKLDPTCSN